MADPIRALLTTDPWELFFGIIEPAYLELTMELCSTFHLQTVMTRYDDPGTIQFHLGGLIRQLSVLEYGAPLQGISSPTIPEVLTRYFSLHDYRKTDRHRKRVISIGPYVTRLARHFGLLNTAAQESSLTLIGQISPEGISSMLSMRMIERHRGTYPPQYHLAQSTEEEAYEDIFDDVPPRQEDPPTQPPPPSRPVHAVASYADISDSSDLSESLVRM
ncbi:hypothetical protein GOBAR_AA37795 [Gossypium barbadense]|uniref:Uncharacterized protein n=1 Tax=Gossypium barbadense TaxID=3634 RepID=A0A2P5VVU4_GOSBA|nr:hypothetical protein GOBAR_AA37795 [Gossypium barbadense]